MQQQSTCAADQRGLAALGVDSLLTQQRSQVLLHSHDTAQLSTGEQHPQHGAAAQLRVGSIHGMMQHFSSWWAARGGAGLCRSARTTSDSIRLGQLLRAELDGGMGPAQGLRGVLHVAHG